MTTWSIFKPCNRSGAAANRPGRAKPALLVAAAGRPRPLRQRLFQLRQCGARLLARQKQEIVDVALELRTRHTQRIIRDIFAPLHPRWVETLDRRQLAMKDKVPAIAEAAEKSLDAPHGARRMTFFGFDQYPRPTPFDRPPRASQHAVLMSFDIDLDEADIAAIDLVERPRLHGNITVQRRLGSKVVR